LTFRHSRNGGLDQYGAEPIERQRFGAAGVKGVNKTEEKSLKFTRRYCKVS